MKALLALSLLITFGPIARPADVDFAARATNEWGIDLYRQLATGQENLCLSPYSIQSALAMTFAGAEGETRAEMSRVLRFSGDDDAIHVSFAALETALGEISRKTSQIAERSKEDGGPSEPITLSIANRLFVQNSYALRDAFQELVRKFYGAPLERLNFKENPGAARVYINDWVAKQTRDKIRDLIPARGVNESTRLVLANAIYLKAPWSKEFRNEATRPAPFHVKGGATVDVATMRQHGTFGFANRDGFAAIALPYIGGELQLLVLLPNEPNGLSALESKLSAETLAQCTNLPPQDVDLSLPKFKFAPPTISLGEKLQALGIKSAFDIPRGSANFDRMAPRTPDDYLAISEVFHKTFIAVDERGTAAAAATVTVIVQSLRRVEKPPLEVKIDRPFIYAIQHVPSGACLFIGRVTDPR